MTSSVVELGDKLHEALHNSKTKEQDIVDIISNTDLYTRLSISHYYETVYKKKLNEDLKSKLSSDFRDLVIDLFTLPNDVDAENLKKNIKDEKLIVETLTTQPKFMIDELKKSYKTLTRNELKNDIEKTYSTNPHLKKNLVTLLNSNRSTNEHPNKSQCEKDADLLIKHKEDDWFNDEKIFENIFCKKSPEELVMIARYYYKKKGISLLDAIEKNATGKNKDILKEVFMNTINPCELYAEKLYNAIKGIGTDDKSLIRILSSRGEIDMDDIREMYNWKFNQNLIDDITGDTSGPYRDLLIKIAEK